MVNNQKNIFKPSYVDSRLTDIQRLVDEQYLKNLKFLFTSLFIFFVIAGIVHSKKLSLIAIIALGFIYLFFYLYKNQKIKNQFFRISVYSIISIYIYFLFSEGSIASRFFIFIYVLPVFSYFIFKEKEILYSSLLSLGFFLILYFLPLGLYNIEIQQVIGFSVIYIIFTIGLSYFSKTSYSELSMLKDNFRLELAEISQEKKIMGFALHQIRTTVNNLIVYEEFSYNGNEKSEEIEFYRKLAINAFCASMAVLEDLSDSKMRVSEDCSFQNVVKKIITYYRLICPNVHFEKFEDLNIELKKTKDLILFIKAIFLILDLINHIAGKEKVNVFVENIILPKTSSVVIGITQKINFQKDYVYKFYIEKLKNLVSGLDGELVDGKNSKFSCYFEIKVKNEILREKTLVEKERDASIKDKKFFRLLLAEDDEVNQKIYLFGFKKIFKEIDVVSNGAEVMSALEQKNYDLLVMDLQMPKLNGLETVKKIRNIENISGNHLIIIGISANTLIYNKTEILNFGFDDYFIKPFKIKDIYNSFLKILEKQKNKQYE